LLFLFTMKPDCV